MTPSSYLKLPLSFDLSRLRQDLDTAMHAKWIKHFNTRDYVKDWSCIPLRSIDGGSEHILPIESDRYGNTSILDACPYFIQVLDQFECEKTSVRLMSLEAGGEIKEHRDQGTCLEDGIARLHIPIQTSPEVLFRIDGEEVHFSAGDTWYLNASCLHGVTNHSSLARIHLMIDCISNPWLETLFRQSHWQPRSAPVYGDPAINDENVSAIIAQLRLSSSETAQMMADQLHTIYAQRQLKKPT
ncbi:aspartyl/asparaginyl beta-hydroxylase domain-containing protein [Undibacterium fentianense]|uniref:Aspartyl/asparaginyl beta-hydroxylase domain-containing protein n=1 Tax=Undibacterium fentianense TaxID=2828728 RepID=A0A941E6L2_9BURK|nr:aspartyl/asparaginyl beta-hydroxylase domain-containing protein [Undibacterium fentianense]MBR7800713.1 aspartyl/asparaginyl beta-hydroxylase domain-containing protein [Undibacterium fentianense]